MKLICGRCGQELTVALGASSGADVVKLQCATCFTKLGDLEKVFYVVGEAIEKHAPGKDSV